MNEQLIVLGGGCFWCIEAQLKLVPGVTGVVSGYAGGETVNPTYDQVCGGRTGHAEVTEVTFDADRLSLGDLLWFFLLIHDPTTLNRQGADAGTQYRSIILTSSDEQLAAAQAAIAEVADQQVWPDPIVTQVVPLEVFYPAETYHQNYMENNPQQAYCQIVISPKLGKLRSSLLAKLEERQAVQAR